MIDDKSKRKIKKDFFKAIGREKKKNYIILYISIILIFFILFMISYIKNYFTLDTFLQSVLINLLGLFPAIFLFDFFYRKISLDSSSADLANKVTNILMSNPETLELFTEKQCQNFISSIVYTIVKDKEIKDMIMSNLRPYLTSNICYSVRTLYEYGLELQEQLPDIFNQFADKGKYYYVQERVYFKIRYLGVNKTSLLNRFSIVFAFNNVFLDRVFRNNINNENISNCIFRESLELDINDINYFKSLSESDFREQFNKMFKLNVQVDNCIAEVSDIKLDDNGIIVNMNVASCEKLEEHSIKIFFYMPKLWKSILEISFIEPTKSPKVFVRNVKLNEN